MDSVTGTRQDSATRTYLRRWRPTFAPRATIPLLGGAVKSVILPFLRSAERCAMDELATMRREKPVWKLNNCRLQ